MLNNLMLVHDAATFRRKFSDAEAFLTTARLRHEAYELIRISKQQFRGAEWKKDRLAELLEMSACQEQWFKDLIGR